MKNSQIIQNNQKAIGFIDLIIPNKDNPNQAQKSIRGTGFVISEDGTFVTNAHVFLEIPEKEREFLGFNLISKMDEKKILIYSRYPVELIKLNQEEDLALLKIKSNGQKFNFIKNLGSVEDIEEGEEMLTLGYPLATEMLIMNFGITQIANNCIVSAIKRKAQDGSLHFFLINTHINLGASGSPIFSKDSGKIVGIVSGRIGTKIPIPGQESDKNFEISANIGICLTVDSLKKLLINIKNI